MPRFRPGTAAAPYDRSYECRDDGCLPVFLLLSPRIPLFLVLDVKKYLEHLELGSDIFGLLGLVYLAALVTCGRFISGRHFRSVL